MFSEKQISLNGNCQGNAAEKNAVERLAVKDLKLPPEGK